jgi:acetyl-CoA carboxylase carboxyl transferase subunit alpha
VDKVVDEPQGGAHRNWDDMFASLGRALTETLADLRKQSLDRLLNARYKRLMEYGRFKEEK